MLITAIIVFREFLEAFLLIGIFIGIDRKLNVRKQKEILFAAFIGICISLLLPILVFLTAGNIRNLLTEKNIDMLEGYLLTFSGFFIAYVVFSLHASMKNYRNKKIANAHEKMEQKIFDISLFLTIIFFIVREGFEVALLISTTSLFSVFWVNIAGLIVGFLAAFIVGFLAMITYIKFPIKKVFKYTEYLIIIMGSAMVMNGISMLLEVYFHIHLEKYFSLSLQFLPNEETILGHLLKNLFGVQQEMGIFQIGIMAAYIIVIYRIFIIRKFLSKR